MRTPTTCCRSRSAPICAGREDDEFICTTTKGQPIHNSDFHELRFDIAKGKASKLGVPTTVRFQDLRHTHAAWLISAGVPLTVIQQRLGHESITTTNDLYGGLPPR